MAPIPQRWQCHQLYQSLNTRKKHKIQEIVYVIYASNSKNYLQLIRSAYYWIMVNPLTAMVRQQVHFLIYTILTNSTLTSLWLVNVKLNKFQQIDQTKMSKRASKFRNPKNGRTLERGWALGNLPYYNYH